MEKIMKDMAEIQANGSTYYYPPYDQYSTNDLASTDHYLAVLPKRGQTGLGCIIEFYVNTSILPTNYSSSSLFTIGTNYTGNASIQSITTSNPYNSIKEFDVKYNSSLTAPDSGALFTYKLGKLTDSYVFTERDVHANTSYVAGYPDVATSVIRATNGAEFKKCVYAIGDANRDGIVDSNDAEDVLQCVIDMAESDPSRSPEDQAYDEAAFKLAADIDRNGVVALQDVVAINRFLLGGTPDLG